MNITGFGFLVQGRGKIHIMRVCVCRGTNKLRAHLHTQMRECNEGRAVGGGWSVVGLSAGVEIRSCGNGVGGVCWWCRRWWEGVGARKERTGGCNTAHYGNIGSKKTKQKRQQIPSLTQADAPSSRLWQSYSTALQQSSFKPFQNAKLARG